MSILRSAVDAVRRFARNQPAVVIGAAISVLVEIQPAVEDVATWEAALPLIASVVIRRFVKPVNPTR